MNQWRNAWLRVECHELFPRSALPFLFGAMSKEIFAFLQCLVSIRWPKVVHLVYTQYLSGTGDLYTTYHLSNYYLKQKSHLMMVVAIGNLSFKIFKEASNISSDGLGHRFLLPKSSLRPPKFKRFYVGMKIGLFWFSVNTVDGSNLRNPGSTHQFSGW